MIADSFQSPYQIRVPPLWVTVLICSFYVFVFLGKLLVMWNVMRAKFKDRDFRREGGTVGSTGFPFAVYPTEALNEVIRRAKEQDDLTIVAICEDRL